MNLRKAFSLCICSFLLLTPSSWAADPSPFALPPETDQAPTAVAPQTAPPTASEPAPAAPTAVQTGTPTPSALPQSGQPPVQTSTTDPDSAFDLPSSGPPAILPPTGGNLPPQGTQGNVTGGASVDLTATALLAQGTELARQGSYEEARTALENALLKEPGNALILNNLGLVMRKLGRLEGATRAYTAAIQSNPNFALTYKNYGILLEQNGERRRAIDAYRKYCSLAPNAPDVQKVSQRADWLAGGL